MIQIIIFCLVALVIILGIFSPDEQGQRLLKEERERKIIRECKPVMNLATVLGVLIALCAIALITYLIFLT